MRLLTLVKTAKIHILSVMYHLISTAPAFNISSTIKTGIESTHTFTESECCIVIRIGDSNSRSSVGQSSSSHCNPVDTIPLTNSVVLLYNSVD